MIETRFSFDKVQTYSIWGSVRVHTTHVYHVDVARGQHKLNDAQTVESYQPVFHEWAVLALSLI